MILARGMLALLVAGLGLAIAPPAHADSVVATIPVGSSPAGVAISPNGAFAYVANLASNTVSRIDTATNTVTATIQVGAGPHGTAISPDGVYAYVSNTDDGSVSRIDTSTNMVSATIPIGQSPNGVAISPDGRFAYVTGVMAVHRIATATNTVTAEIPVGENPNVVAISPDSSFALVSHFGPGYVTRIDTASDTVTTTIPSLTSNSSVAISPDGTYAYASGWPGLTRIVTAANTATTYPHVWPDWHPYQLAISPTGVFAYVTDDRDDAFRLDPITNTVTTGVKLPTTGGPLAISPDGSFALVLIARLNVVARIQTSEPPPDSDGDGIPDALDQCPTQAGPASNNGCPIPPLPDTDGDGIPDALDQCPTQAGPAGNNGCPPPTSQPVEPLPAPAAVVRVAAKKKASKLAVDVDPDSVPGRWSFQVQRYLPKKAAWVAGKSYRTKGAHQTRTINLPKGKYRVQVTGRNGYQGVTSAVVTLRK